MAWGEWKRGSRNKADSLRCESCSDGQKQEDDNNNNNNTVTIIVDSDDATGQDEMDVMEDEVACRAIQGRSQLRYCCSLFPFVDLITLKRKREKGS